MLGLFLYPQVKLLKVKK